MWAIIVFLTIGLYNMFKNPQSNVRSGDKIIFSDFLTSVDNGEILKVEEPAVRSGGRKVADVDELINVLKGDLNLVGPRPGLETQLELKNARVAKDIFSVKPGITGLAQILGYDMSNPEKLAEVDQIFVLNESFLLKTMILIGTFFKYPRKYISIKYKININ